MNNANFTFPVLENPAPSLSLDDAEKIAEKWLDSPTGIKRLDSERDQNFYVQNAHNEGFVLKVANSKEDWGTLDFQNQALKHLAKTTTLSLPRVKSDLLGSEIATISLENEECFVRLVTFLEGEPLGNINSITNVQTLYSNMGTFLGNLGLGLKDLQHHSSKHKLLWDMSHTNLLYKLLPYIDNKNNRNIAQKALLYFTKYVEKPLSLQRTQVIHNDMNPDNVILQPPRTTQLAGMIDFGDMVEAPLINDLAVAASYQTVAMGDIFKGTSSMLSAYNKVYPLNSDELDLLPSLIMNRIAMSAIISEWRAKEHPGNQEYILGSIKKTWKTLECLVEEDLGAIAIKLKNNLSTSLD